MNPRRRELAALLTTLAIFGLVLASVAGGANLITANVNVGATPAAIGVAQGRVRLRVTNPTIAAGAIRCGPMDQPLTSYIVAIPGQTLEFGVYIDRDDQSSASEVIGCALAATVTPTIVVAIQEEGNMPDWTKTATNTATATAVNTATRTATPSETPTETPG